MTRLREKSHFLLWTLLFFFIASMAVGGLVGGANIMDLIFGSRNIQINAGRIGDQTITHVQYQREREIQLNRLRRQGQKIDNRAYQNAGDFAWNTIIERQIKDKKIKELGLEVSLDEIYDFLLNTPPQSFQTDLLNAGYFSNDDGKFDTKSYQETVQNGLMPKELNPLLVNWENYLRTWLADRKLQFLYNQLGSISDNEIRNKYIKDSLNCNIDYVYISISSIHDSLIKITDDQILSRYEEDKEDVYSLKDRISVEYVLFKIPPIITAEDSLEATSISDSVMQLAQDFVAEADFSSFSNAMNTYNISNIDTIDIHETFESNSGIPFSMGVLRPAVRFAFDNSIGTISDPISAQNGIAIFHSINKISSGFKPIDDVSANIRRSLIRENKIDYTKNKLQTILDNSFNWNELSNIDSLIKYESNQTQKIGGSFPNIGRSNDLTGTLLVMQPNETSSVIETFNSILVVKMNSKDEIDEEKYQTDYNNIRETMLNAIKGRSYTSWLSTSRNSIHKEDYRSEVY